MANIHDVAKRANCSITTVSMVINGTGRISPKTREHVLRVVDEIGYTPNAAGKTLKTRRTENIGILFILVRSHFRQPFYAGVMDGVEEILSEESFNLLIAGFKMTENQIALPKFIRERSVEGLILLGRFPDAYIQALHRLDTPFLLLDNENPNIPVDSIISDGFNGAKTAVGHLIERGHRRIAMLAANPEDASTLRRFKGYQAALKEHHIPFHEELVARGENMASGGIRAARTLLERKVDFTAIFSVNDEMGLSAMQTLQGAGYRFPKDISIVGFDDIEKASHSDPPLTTLRVDRIEMGNLGAKTILARVRNPEDPPRQIELPVRLIERASTRTIKAT
jgi:LacI family transcriptional regulator